MAKNVIIKQKKSKTEVVDIYPQTESNIVINNSTEITGNTITDAFDNALPLTGGKNISINPNATGVEIAFTGSLAPNVSVTGETHNPVLVTGTPSDTSATYKVKHDTVGPSSGYTSGNDTTTIGAGTSKTIKIPQITVDTYGHVTAAADENVTITIPSVTNMVTGTNLTADKIILGNSNSKVKASSYGISTDNKLATDPSSNVPTVSAVKTYVDNAITNGAQYLGLVNGINDDGTLKLDDTTITPNSQGDWARASAQFTVAYTVNGSTGGGTETAHKGDILIYHAKDSSNRYLWDIVHTEVDTDTWRPIQINGTSIDINNIHPTLNLTAGSNVSLSSNGGEVTIRATDTTYTLTQNTSTKNQFTFTPVGKTGTTITIDNVANAVNATTATTATTATKVANALTVQFNGTNQFTYNGSAAKTLNVTASGIGAAASSHDHGNITSDGRISSINDTPITSNSKIVITDDSGKIVRSTVQFDGSTTTKALTPSGQWKEFLQANQTITIISGLKHKNLDTDPNVLISGTAHSRSPVLGESGVDAGIYSAIEVNKQGIAIAGSQVIKYYAWGTTDKFIKEDTNLASGGFAFVELP